MTSLSVTSRRFGEVSEVLHERRLLSTLRQRSQTNVTCQQNLITSRVLHNTYLYQRFLISFRFFRVDRQTDKQTDTDIQTDSRIDRRQWLKCNATQGNAVPHLQFIAQRVPPPQIVIMLGKGTRPLSGAQTSM